MLIGRPPTQAPAQVRFRRRLAPPAKSDPRRHRGQGVEPLGDHGESPVGLRTDDQGGKAGDAGPLRDRVIPHGLLLKGRFAKAGFESSAIEAQGGGDLGQHRRRGDVASLGIEGPLQAPQEGQSHRRLDPARQHHRAGGRVGVVNEVFAGEDLVVERLA